jgi:hypothetical protein
MQQIKQATKETYRSVDFSSAYNKLFEITQGLKLEQLKKRNEATSRGYICDFYASRVLQNKLEGNIVAAFKEKTAVDALTDQLRWKVSESQISSIKTEIEKLDAQDPDRAILLKVTETLPKRY